MSSSRQWSGFLPLLAKTHSLDSAAFMPRWLAWQAHSWDYCHLSLITALLDMIRSAIEPMIMPATSSTSSA